MAELGRESGRRAAERLRCRVGSVARIVASLKACACRPHGRTGLRFSSCAHTPVGLHSVRLCVNDTRHPLPPNVNGMHNVSETASSAPTTSEVVLSFRNICSSTWCVILDLRVCDKVPLYSSWSLRLAGHAGQGSEQEPRKMTHEPCNFASFSGSQGAGTGNCAARRLTVGPVVSSHLLLLLSSSRSQYVYRKRRAAARQAAPATEVARSLARRIRSPPCTLSREASACISSC